MKECTVGRGVWDPIRSGAGFELVVEGALEGGEEVENELWRV